MKAVQLIPIPEQAAFYVRDAAKYIGVSPNTLRKRADLGLIPARRDENGNRVFLLRDLNHYLNSLPPYEGSGKPVEGRSVEIGRNEKGGANERPNRQG